MQSSDKHPCVYGLRAGDTRDILHRYQVGLKNNGGYREEEEAPTASQHWGEALKGSVKIKILWGQGV